MDFLINANIAYVLLVVGMMLGFLALLTPGTGMLEVATLFALALAGYVALELGITAFNAWALIPLLLAIVPFLLALRFKTWRAPLLVTTIALVIGGSIFLFKGEDGSLIGVNPLLAVIVSVLYGGFLWIAVERSLAAMLRPLAHNIETLIGQVGEARTEIKDAGSVQVGGELWSARSETPITPGSVVRIVQRDGFVLIVEQVSK
jgi:membrane-bound serine protease (ClpP class)